MIGVVQLSRLWLTLALATVTVMIRHRIIAGHQASSGTGSADEDERKVGLRLRAGRVGDPLHEVLQREYDKAA